MTIEEPPEPNISTEGRVEREKRLRLRNGMQVELAKRMCGDAEDKTKILEWLEEHSKRFRELVGRHSEDIIEMYKNEPEKALTLAERELAEEERVEE